MLEVDRLFVFIVERLFFLWRGSFSCFDWYSPILTTEIAKAKNDANQVLTLKWRYSCVGELDPTVE